MLPTTTTGAQTLLVLVLALATLMVAGPLLWQLLRRRDRLHASLAYACCTCLLLLSGCAARVPP